MKLSKFLVKIRRGSSINVRPESEQIDGKIYTFYTGWKIETNDPRYPGEMAYIPRDSNYPDDAPIWIASGDLVRVTR